RGGGGAAPSCERRLAAAEDEGRRRTRGRAAARVADRRQRPERVPQKQRAAKRRARCTREMLARVLQLRVRVLPRHARIDAAHGAAVVEDRQRRQVDDLPAGGAEAQAEVALLRVNEEAVVEAADGGQRL